MTQFIEFRLEKGENIPIFRLSYLKAMGRDIRMLIQQLLSPSLLPNDPELNKFFLDFKMGSSDRFL